MDDLESMNQAFGLTAGEFMRTQVIPELDAYRFAKLASASGVTSATGTLSAGSGVVTALNTAYSNLVDAEVDTGNLVLFITSSLHSLADTQTIISAIPCPVLKDATVVDVPAGRFHTVATLNAGSSASAGGFTAAGVAINFILMDKGAAFVDAKHEVPRIFSPAVNQVADAWKFDYRLYHDAFVWDNKAAGIYVNKAAS